MWKAHVWIVLHVYSSLDGMSRKEINELCAGVLHPRAAFEGF